MHIHLQIIEVDVIAFLMEAGPEVDVDEVDVPWSWRRPMAVGTSLLAAGGGLGLPVASAHPLDRSRLKGIWGLGKPYVGI